MDDLQKFLPFLLIAAFYIFSAVRNSKKQKETDLSKTTLPQGVPKTDTQTKVVNKPDPSVQRASRFPIQSKGQQEIDYNPEVKRTIAEPEVEISEQQEEDSVAMFELDVENKDELRRAIIYSEILERKY